MTMRKMNFLPLLALLLLVASASASIFKGGDVKPDRNPIVDKYHTDTDIQDVLERLVVYIVIGVVGSVVMLTVTLIYYTYRFCRTWLCCCIKACRVNKTRPRSDSLERELTKANPVISWVLRGFLVLLFIPILILIAIGFAASNEVHNNIVETTATIDTHVSYLNKTAYDANFTLSHLIHVNVSQSVLSNLTQLTNDTNQAASYSHQLNQVGPYVDAIRRNTTVAVYVFAFLPLLIGLVGAIIGKGRLTYIMSMILPLLIIGLWLLFAFHYCMFTITVDVCYSVDQFLVAEQTDNETNTTTTALASFNCSSFSASVNPLIIEAKFLTNYSEALLNVTTDQNQREELIDQISNLQNLTATIEEFQDCGSLTKIITVAYPDICGKTVEASLFLWGSQVGLVIILLCTAIIGVIGETKIIGGRNKKKKDDYSTLALLN